MCDGSGIELKEFYAFRLIFTTKIICETDVPFKRNSKEMLCGHAVPFERNNKNTLRNCYSFQKEQQKCCSVRKEQQHEKNTKFLLFFVYKETKFKRNKEVLTRKRISKTETKNRKKKNALCTKIKKNQFIKLARERDSPLQQEFQWWSLPLTAGKRIHG